MRGHAQLRNSQTTGILNVEREKCKFNQGIFIDIFPLDRVVDDNFLFQKQKKKALYYNSCARKIANITVNYDLSENTGVKKIIKKTFIELKLTKTSTKSLKITIKNIIFTYFVLKLIKNSIFLIKF
jgi:phosphorylcholine metabolism protein LicD